jgi:hypothetical protein
VGPNHGDNVEAISHVVMVRNLAVQGQLEVNAASVITSKAAIRDRVKTGHTKSDRDRII